MLYLTAVPGHRAIRANVRSREALMGRLLDAECRAIRGDLSRKGLL